MFFEESLSNQFLQRNHRNGKEYDKINRSSAQYLVMAVVTELINSYLQQLRISEA